LASLGIHTIGQLAAAGSPILKPLLGAANGTKLALLSANTDPRRVEKPRPAGSIGAQAAFAARAPTRDLLREMLGYLADRVGRRLRRSRRAGRTVTVRVRFTQLRSVTRSMTLPVAISSTLTLADTAVLLVASALSDHPSERQITLLGVAVSNLAGEEALQLEFPVHPIDEAERPGTRRGAARWAVDRSVDAVRDKFGDAAVGYARVVFSKGDRVPEDFRRLAERPGKDESSQRAER
jgi:DNA polymerase-4